MRGFCRCFCLYFPAMRCHEVVPIYISRARVCCVCERAYRSININVYYAPSSFLCCACEQIGHFLYLIWTVTRLTLNNNAMYSTCTTNTTATTIIITGHCDRRHHFRYFRYKHSFLLRELIAWIMLDKSTSCYWYWSLSLNNESICRFLHHKQEITKEQSIFNSFALLDEVAKNVYGRGWGCTTDNLILNANKIQWTIPQPHILISFSRKLMKLKFQNRK